MRIFFAPAVLLAFSLVCFNGSTNVRADGRPDGAANDTKDKDSTGKSAPKPDTPAPGLTTREQWMLERIEQLEKRVAELESKGSGSSSAASKPTPAADASGSLPLSSSAVSASPAPSASGIPTTNAAAVNPASSSSVSVKQDQTTANAAVATNRSQEPVEPFSDADWTWLNGNARTKEIYWDTKFFTPEIRSTPTTLPTSTIQRITPSAARASSSARTKFSSSNWA